MIGIEPLQLGLLAVIIVFTAYLILKKYQAHTILLLSGMLLIGIAIITNPSVDFFPKGYKTTGSKFLDIFELFRAVAGARFASLGLIIMASGGFSKYMDHIGAADVMVGMATKPLKKFKNVYVVLSLTYILGQCINIFIPSASGLAILLLVSVYPILISLNIRPIAAVSVIATTSCLDLGPASAAANAAAEWIGISTVEFFVKHQLIVTAVTAPLIAVLTFFTHRFFDKMEGVDPNAEEVVMVEKELKQVPKIYALLPILPLLLLIIFSKFIIKSINMHVVTAMFVSTMVAMAFELIRVRDFKKISKDIMIFFKGMGELFASVVSLLICAEIFTTGFMALGGVDALIKFGENTGFPPFFMMLIMVLLIIFSVVLTGSGNAPFFAFGHLAPDIAKRIGVDTLRLVLPMQLVCGMSRSISPISGVMIICAASANVSPFAIVKRTLIPMVAGIISVILSGWFFA